LQKHNPQLIELNKSIGSIKGKFSKDKIEIYQAYYSLKRIKQFQSNDELKPLIDLIGKWRFYIGVKEELSQEELFMNVNFIRENFSELNLVDINQAINLSIKGALNVDVEHYQSFTPLYISKILNAYKKYKGEVIFGIRDSINKIEDKPKEISIKDRIALTRGSLSVLYEKRNDKNFYDYGNVTYDFIKKNNLFPITKELVEQAMIYGKKQVSSSIKDSAITDALNNTNKFVKDARQKKEFNIRQNARNYVVIQWLKSFEQKQFDEFLKSINEKMI